MSERVSHVVTMIHGTFAKNALWTSDGSNLCKALREHLPGDLVIRRFPWSGANRNSDRIEAAKKLADALNENLASYPYAAHFVIAHSHGGNLALYAMGDSRLQEGLRLWHYTVSSDGTVSGPRRGGELLARAR
jgi:hypothetical protein